MATNIFNPISGRTYKYNSWWDDNLWQNNQPTNGVNPYLQEYPRYERPQPPAPPTTPVNPVVPPVVVPPSNGGGSGGSSLPIPISATMSNDGGLSYNNFIGGYGYEYGPGVYGSPQQFMNETGIGDPEWDMNHPANMSLSDLGNRISRGIASFNPTQAQGLGLAATILGGPTGLGPLVANIFGNNTDWGNKPMFDSPPLSGFNITNPFAGFNITNPFSSGQLSPGDSGYTDAGSASDPNMAEAGFSQEDQDFINSGFGDDSSSDSGSSSSSSGGGFSATDNGGGSYGGGDDGGYSDAQSEADMGW